MSDEFPSRSCVGAFLSRDDVAEGEDHSPLVSLISGRDRKNREVLTQLTRESETLWAVRKVELWMVGPRPRG